MTSNFDKVCQFNKVFGLPHHQNLQKNIFNENPKLVKLRLDLITEEVNELQDAIKTQNMKEVIDALSDILYVVYGAGSSLGIDLNQSFNIVHESNMSKSCQTEEQAKETVKLYQQQYQDGTSPYDSPSYRYDPEADLYIIYNESTGKILKNKDYQEADFTKMLI